MPFYQFLDHVGRRAAHSFKSDMPLIDATYVSLSSLEKLLLTIIQDHVYEGVPSH